MPAMAGGPSRKSDTDGPPSDLLDRYLTLIRHAVTRAASRRAAPFQDDIAQAVAIAVWRVLERGQPVTQPASYVYKAVVRETVRALRRVQRGGEVPLDAADSEALAADSDTEAVLAHRELGEIIEACLEGLSDDRARAVRAHLGGLEVAEIMRLYGWSYQRARNLVARGMADLRAALGARGVTR
jgi:RNA polymerase sigma factor (sigma-70 family)